MFSSLIINNLIVILPSFYPSEIYSLQYNFRQAMKYNLMLIYLFFSALMAG